MPSSLLLQLLVLLHVSLAWGFSLNVAHVPIRGLAVNLTCQMQRVAHQVATSQERLAQASALLVQAQHQGDFFAQHLLVLVLLRARRQAAAQANSAPAIALLRGLQGMWGRMEVGLPQNLILLASMSNTLVLNR